MDALQLPVEQSPHGRYILELVLGEKLGASIDNVPGTLRFWYRRGSKPGIDDEMLYVHMASSGLGGAPCQGLLPSEFVILKLCPHCGFPIGDAVAECLFFNVPPSQIARLLAMHYRSLEGNCDVRLYRSKVDLSIHNRASDPTSDPRDRIAATLELRKGQECSLYIKSRIEKDLLDGGDIIRKFEAFIRA